MDNASIIQMNDLIISDLNQKTPISFNFNNFLHLAQSHYPLQQRATETITRKHRKTPMMTGSRGCDA